MNYYKMNYSLCSSNFKTQIDVQDPVAKIQNQLHAAALWFP